MSEEPILEDAEQTTQPSKGNPSVAKQKSIEDTAEQEMHWSL